MWQVKKKRGGGRENGLERKVKPEVSESTRRYQSGISKRWWCFWTTEAAREVGRISNTEDVF